MKLEMGKLYELDGRPWRCVFVNDFRAKLQPVWKERRSFVGADGIERDFFATPDSIDVSPHSVLREWFGAS